MKNSPKFYLLTLLYNYQNEKLPKFYLLTLLDLKGLLDRKKEVDVHPDALFKKKTHPDTPFG